MDLLECVSEAWRWTGIVPVEVVDLNDFGNLLIRDVDRRVWWIRPDLLSCEVVANDDDAYRRLRSDKEFSIDWEMQALVALARRHVGPLDRGRSYCLKIPATIGGPYEPKNLASLNTVELVGVSGDIAQQIRDLPDGTPVEIKIVD